MTNSNIKQQVLARASKDLAFRQALVSDPRAALMREFNIQLLDSVTIRALEDTLTTCTIVLLAREVGMLELSDTEFNAVTGLRC
jgi:hypothetical protein